jgi:hypothetical protein
VCKGSLSLDGNQTASVKAKGSLTARPTSRAGAKAGLSDPTVPRGRAVAQRIKVTLGITGLSSPRVHIDGKVWHLDIGGRSVEIRECQSSCMLGKPSIKLKLLNGALA